MSDDRLIVVFDDLRSLPDAEYNGVSVVHVRTNRDFMGVLERCMEEEITVQVLLDHDLGGVAFGPETSREGIMWMVHQVRHGYLNVEFAVIITMNPDGQRWIRSELDAHDILYNIDPGGRQMGMTAHKGF